MKEIPTTTIYIRSVQVIGLWCCLLWVFSLPAQSVQWTSFDDLPDSLRSAPKPLLIFIHTDWCQYCKLQDQNTFGDEQLSRLINEEYYALRLNAESSADITFLNRTYGGQNNAYHELAELLGKAGGRLVFPTTVILSKNFSLVHRFTGLLEAGTLLDKLKFAILEAE